MRVPQVSERIKEAPAQALRGVFAGIGQLLLITDKLRNKAPASQQVPQARTPEASETVAPAASVPADAPAPAAAPAAPAAAASPPAAPAPASAASAAPAPVSEAPNSVSASEAPASTAAAVDRDFDKTGNVRLLTSAEAGAGDTAPTSDAAVAEMAAAAVEMAAPVVEVAPPVVGVTAVAEMAAGAPLPNYDGLSIASLRARLRNLDVAQLRQLVGYERAHADRADVIAMFERRIAKLQAETTPEERGEAAAEAEVEARDDVEAEVQDEVGAEAEDEA